MFTDNVFIYVLEYSDINQLYIGATTSPKRRLANHKKGEIPADKIICQSGIRDIKMTILKECYYTEKHYWEKYFIELFLSFDYELKNKQPKRNESKCICEFGYENRCGY